VTIVAREAVLAIASAVAEGIALEAVDRIVETIVRVHVIQPAKLLVQAIAEKNV
jgi:hypothetical protein